MTPDAPLSASQQAELLEQLVDTLVGIDAAISGLMAARTRLLDLMRGVGAPSPSDEMAFRSLRAEVACALRLPERTVESLFGQARLLVRDLPETMAALGVGEVTYRHAQVVVDHAADLDADARATFERLAVPVAAASTPTGFDRAARKLRESLDPTTIEKRTKAAVESREAVWIPGRDGMGDLILHLPAQDGQAVYARATERARQLLKAGDPRTLTQLRVDTMRDALLTGTFDALGGKQLRPEVFVTVPVLSLLGLSPEPATLDGYGPIALSTARELAAHAPSFIRILNHPETGARLSVGRRRYPTPDLKNILRTQYSTCGMPMCTVPAQFCEIDHTVDWAKGGQTGMGNLAPLCRGHHHLKHNSAWEVRQEHSGALRWRSPAGKRYRKPPDGLTA